MSLIWYSLFVFTLGAATPADQAKEFYFKGIVAFQGGKYKESEQHFRKVYDLLGQAHAAEKSQRKKYLLSLGQCDVFFHLAQIALKQKQNRIACLRYNRLLTRLNKIPKEWPTWKVHPNLPGRFQKTREAISGSCQQVPSQVELQIKQTDATVEVAETKEGQVTWKPLKQRNFSTRQTSLTLRVSAKGYITKTLKNVKVERWTKQPVKIELAVKPIPRKVVKRPVKTPTVAPTPIYKKWWFWTGIGVVVAGGATAAVLAATATRQEVLVGEDGGAFRIFKN